MISDSLSSIFDNIKQRTTNPFLGTLIVVWTIKNWKLVYSLFYFDTVLKLDDRLAKITDHFKDQSFLLNMVLTIFITLGVLILTYLLLSLSRLVTDAYDKILLPFLSKLTDKSSVVLKSEYLALKEVLKQLEVRLEDERLAKVTAQQQRDLAENTLTEFKAIQISVESNTNTEETVNTLEDRSNGFFRLANLIGSGIGSSVFNHIIEKVLNNESIHKDDEGLKFLLREGIIKYKSYVNTSAAKYNVTEFGNDFLRYWNQFMESQSA